MNPKRRLRRCLVVLLVGALCLFQMPASLVKAISAQLQISPVLVSDEDTPVATDTTTTDSPIWTIENLYVTPGSECEYLTITEENGVAASAMLGTLYFPKETREILSPAYYDVIGDFIYESNYSSSSLMVNTEKFETDGLFLYTIYTTGTIAKEDGSAMLNIWWEIADEETIREVAEKYEMEEQTDAFG